MKIIKTVKTAEFGGYFSGELPEYQGSLIGSSNVDISNISSLFSGAQESVQVVNNFDSSLLQNIVYIFNFSKSGVYGVYVPALDRAVKTQELGKRLTAMGYKIIEEDGRLNAYPTKEEKDPQEIKKDIQREYDDLMSKGGSVIGVNINDSKIEAQGSYDNLEKSMVIDENGQTVPMPDSVKQSLKHDLMVIHLAATIAHEATHAKGAEDEAQPVQVEKSLLNKKISELKNKYNMVGDFTVGGSNNWYKVAQAHFPFYPPSGSDLQGRHGNWDGNLQGQPDFGMMAQQYSNRAIEEMLGRQLCE